MTMRRPSCLRPDGLFCGRCRQQGTHPTMLAMARCKYPVVLWSGDGGYAFVSNCAPGAPVGTLYRRADCPSETTSCGPGCSLDHAVLDAYYALHGGQPMATDWMRDGAPIDPPEPPPPPPGPFDRWRLRP